MYKSITKAYTPIHGGGFGRPKRKLTNTGFNVGRNRKTTSGLSIIETFWGKRSGAMYLRVCLATDTGRMCLGPKTSVIPRKSMEVVIKEDHNRGQRLG